MITTVKELLRLITFAGKVIERNPLLPILGNILIHEGYVTGSNLQVYAKIKTKLKENFCVEYKPLLAILKTLPKDEGLKIKVDVNKITFSTKTKTFSLVNWDISDYPKTPECKNEIGILDSSHIQVINEASAYVSDDELRPSLCNVYVNGSIAATNAHILFYKHLPTKLKERESILIPQKVAKLTTTFIAASIHSFGSYIELRDNEKSLIFRECDEKYPDFKSVIPEEEEYKLSFSIVKSEFERCLKSLSVLAPKTDHRVIMQFFTDSETIKFSTKNHDKDFSYSETMIAEFHKTEEVFKIAANASFFKHLMIHASDVLTIKMIAANRPIVINDEVLIMPVMIS